jgi:tripartite-type tricarboxylate transporter receptor subunit TctC
MPIQIVRRAAIAALLVLSCSAATFADIYPSRPIRLIVPTQAGAAQDVIARLLQPYLEKSLGQPVIVENRSGASTMIGTDSVAKAAPDGYTLLIVPTTFTVNAALNVKLPFDPEQDFEPVTVLVKNPLLFAVNAKVPAKTLSEFVALVKKEPEKFNYGTSGASTQAHLLLEMWTTRAGIRMQHIPYRGGAPAALAVATGEVQFVLLSPLGMWPQLQAGTVRALATGGLTRDPQLPDLPTAAEAGFPGLRGGAVAGPSRPREDAEGHRFEDQRRSEQGFARSRPDRQARATGHHRGRHHAGGIQDADRDRNQELERNGAARGVDAAVIYVRCHTLRCHAPRKRGIQ